MHEVLGQAVSAIFSLPDWTPRAFRRAAALVLALIVIFAPDSFRAGVTTWVRAETQVILKRMAPVLEPAPAITD